MGIWAMTGLWAVLGGLATPAVAQEFDEDLDDFEFEEPVERPDQDADDKTEEPEPEPPEKAEPPPLEEEDTEILDMEFEDAEDEAIDLLDDVEDKKPEGDADTEAMYRDTIEKVEGLPADAGIQEWEAYLQRYPRSLYRTDIEERIEALFDQLYAEGRRVPGQEDGPVDAMRQEINFSQGLLLDNINPRSRLQAGLSAGAPIFLGLMLDVEIGYARRLSTHGGLRSRFGRLGLEVGQRFALVKSTKAQALVTLSLDARLDFPSLYPSFRPVLGFGKKFGSVQLQAQVGTSLDIRDVGGLTMQVLYTGGAQVQWAPSDSVAVFVETQLLFKPEPRDQAFEGGLFSFNVVSVGLAFYPQISRKRPENRDFEAKVGGTLPVAQSYYQYYLGTINSQFNYFL